MSWWTENRKKVGLLAGLAAMPWALPALSGLLGIGGAAAGSAAAGAGAGAALGGGVTGALGTGTSLAGTGLGSAGILGTGASTVGTGLGATAASAAAPASFMNAGLLAANSPTAFTAMSSAPTAWETAMGIGGKALKGLGTANSVIGAASPLMQQPQQKQAPMMPPPQPGPPMPVGDLYSGADTPPPGVDPNQWAAMTPEQKKALMAQRGMA